jgi:NAD+ diphosphatase
LDERAFFFQGDTLLLPADLPDSQLDRGLPLELANFFENPDIFEIPAIDSPAETDGSAAAPVSKIRAVSVLPGSALGADWRAIPVRHVLAMFSAGVAGNTLGVILRACHVAQWRRESRFCGSCGAKNADVPEDAQRLCPECGRNEFPRICPAVIIAITDDDNRILLAHNKRFRAGVYSHISGFNEAGETLEETVVREIREEVNIEVRDIVYVKSQPWPFPNSLMVGFKARYLSGTIRPDGNEIEDAKWFTAGNLPDLPGEGSLSRFLINCWLNGTL